ncbi:TRAP transporter large permease subunit [Stappia taiwanensis]|uniref:TRAP transporter large permease subunit n=1 Tax=Stappia taiwanensis TaxID=992267 RepID=A0A838XMY6_9HYPH|nr:TRAP transporter large permease subunit [Stappia taiwanensis]MBA4612639.1 TRAP transporter large permease subunit [Stappia taiwanensis]GGE88839.1 C4-dicarboxylate ABC transporter [Stappia taiwanensis]
MSLPLDLLMFAALIGAILIGYPVSFTLAGVATLFALAGWATGQFDPGLLGALGQRVFGLMTNQVLTAIPLFVFMGIVLEKSRIAEDLLETAGRLFGPLRGGLGISVVLVGALLAASTGIVGATVVAMGLIALPTMLRNGYDPKLASGIVCTSGTLGQIIPPSTLLIILSDVMSNAYQQAQFREGKFTIDTISVGQIFAAALLPGLTLVGIYILYLLGKAWLNPASAPAMKALDTRPARREIAAAILPPVLLIVAVLGSILGGIATPSEAASVGAIGALLMASARQSKGENRLVFAGAAALGLLAVLIGVHPVRLQRSDAGLVDWLVGGLATVLVLIAAAAIAQALHRTFRGGVLKPVMTSTMSVTAMIFATILTASVFSLVFRGLGGDLRVEEFLANMPGGPQAALLFVMALIFVLGFFLDFVEISVILLPLVAPVLIMMGHDPVWLSILIAINLQTSFLTPPFGFSLFYLRGAAPKEITTGQIYRGVIPFIGLQILGMALIWLWPSVATFLPKLAF